MRGLKTLPLIKRQLAVLEWLVSYSASSAGFFCLEIKGRLSDTNGCDAVLRSSPRTESIIVFWDTA